MEIQNLIKNLEEYKRSLQDESIELIDFDQLQVDLDKAALALSSLYAKERICERLEAEFKSEIKRLAKAICHVKGDSTSWSLVERLLLSPDLSADELLLLREEIKEEFNRCFHSTPRSKVMVDLTAPNFRISEFKTGGKI